MSQILKNEQLKIMQRIFADYEHHKLRAVPSIYKVLRKIHNELTEQWGLTQWYPLLPK